HRLDKGGGQAHLVPLGRVVSDLVYEFKELSRTDDCVWHCGTPDQVLLRHFCAEEAAFKQTFRSNDRQRNVMPDARGHFKFEEVTSGSVEEFQHCRILP